MVQAPSAAGAATNAAGAATDSQTTRSRSPVVGEGGSSSSSSNDPAAASAASTSNGSTTASAAGASSASSSSSSLGTGPPRYMRPPRGETDHASAMPDEMLLRALSYLDLDSSVHASLVAPRWAGLFNETIAQAHCERIYLDQAHAKVLNPGRFHGSYKQMLRHRPRVRMTGFYVLKSSYIKRPVRDMWTELKPGTILEVNYYRYLRFLPNGRLIYGLLYLAPHEAVRVFKEGRHKELSEGHYYVHKGEVVCEVTTHYAIINFRLSLLDGARGKFTLLELTEHSSLGFSDPTGVPIPHKLPHDCFSFYRVTQF